DDVSRLPDEDLARLYAQPAEAPAAAAVTELLRRHDGSLRAQALRRAGRGLADEALQEMRLRLWKYRCRYDPRRLAWRSWAGMILDQRCIDLLRRRARLPPTQEQDDLPDPVDGTTREQRNDFEAALEECLQGLSPENRNLIRRRFWEEKTLQEIADE